MAWRHWLRERLGFPTREELSGLRLPIDDALELPASRDLARLIRACGAMPDGSVLYLEDGVHPPELQKFLEANQIPHPTKLALQTIWPRPSVHHLAVSAGTIDFLAAYAETVAGPEVCIHLAVYQADRILVQACDAPDDPVLINRNLPDEIITQFAERLGLTRKSASPVR